MKSNGKILHSSQLTSEPADFWYVPSKNRLLVACEGFTKRAGANPELVVFDTFSAQGPKLYDYGLNLLKDLEGIPEASKVYFVSEKKIQKEVVLNLQ